MTQATIFIILFPLGVPIGCNMYFKSGSKTNSHKSKSLNIKVIQFLKVCQLEKRNHYTQNRQYTTLYIRDILMQCLGTYMYVQFTHQVNGLCVCGLSQYFVVVYFKRFPSNQLHSESKGGLHIYMYSQLTHHIFSTGNYFLV